MRKTLIPLLIAVQVSLAFPTHQSYGWNLILGQENLPQVLGDSSILKDFFGVYGDKVNTYKEIYPILTNVQLNNMGIGTNQMLQQKDISNNPWYLNSDNAKNVIGYKIWQQTEYANNIEKTIKARENNFATPLDNKPSVTSATQVTNQMMLEYITLSNKLRSPEEEKRFQELQETIDTHELNGGKVILEDEDKDKNKWYIDAGVSLRPDENKKSDNNTYGAPSFITAPTQEQKNDGRSSAASGNQGSAYTVTVDQTARDQEFMYAVRDNNTEKVIALINTGANIDARDYEGKTALMWAAMRGNVPMAELLINNSADIHAISNSGSTMLMQAVINGQIDMVKILIIKGADVHVACFQLISATRLL